MMREIVTSSWFTKLDPERYKRIGISRGVPRNRSGGYRMYRALQPGTWFNSCATPREFMRRYQADVLDPLDPTVVVDDLVWLAGGKIPVLCCWEAATGDTWCHRALVSVWLKDRLGLNVPEFGREACGCGWDHPKLHPSLRSVGQSQTNSANVLCRRSNRLSLIKDFNDLDHQS
jgi:hypothetical protein